MRIVLVSDYYGTYFGGGVQRVVEELARRLVRLGHSVRVLTQNPNGCPPVETNGGVEIVRVPRLNLAPILGSPVALPLRIRLRPLLLEADVLHVHNIFFLLSMLAAFSGSDLPLITTLHLGSLQYLRGGTGVLARAHERTVGRRMLERSDAVTAVSQSVAENAESLNGNRDIRVVPNAVDTEHFRPPSESTRALTGGPMALYVGRLAQNKGPQVLVESIPRVAREFPDARFLFVGEGPLESYLRRRVERLGIARQVSFAGYLPDIVPVLQKASVVVRPSFTEGLPLGVLEAMACGRPVVATRVAGTTEIVQDGDTGVLIEPGSAEALADALVPVLGDPSLSEEMGRRARQWAVQQCSWDSVARQYVSVYEEVAS